MPDIPISKLPEVTTPAATDVIPIVDGTTTKKVQVANLYAASSGSSLVGFLQAGTGAVARTVQAKERDILSAKDFGAVGDGVTNDAAAIQAALNRAAISGSASGVFLPQGAYNIGTTTLTIPTKTTLYGVAKESTFINYSGTGTAIDVVDVTQWELNNFRLDIGSSSSAIGINIRNSASDVLWGRVDSLEITCASIVAGQKGIQVVTSGGHIISANVFNNILFGSIDKPIIRTGSEGNWWTNIVISTWGATASANAIDSACFAETMQARIGGVPSGGSGCAYKQTQHSNLDLLHVDIGAANTALNVTGANNHITLNRTGGTTPVGTIAANNSLLEPWVGGPILFVSKSGVAVNCDGTTNENTLASVTVPAGAIGSNGGLRITCVFSYTNNANNKTLRVKFYDGSVVTTYLALNRTTGQNGIGTVTIQNRNSASSQIGFAQFLETNGGAVALNGASTGSVNTAIATTVLITGQKASSGDTLTLESYIVEIIRP